MSAALGSTVYYVLTAADATDTNRRRQDAIDTGDDVALGAQYHVGNVVAEGDLAPMIVTAVGPNDLANGQVLLDGNDSLWVTGKPEVTEVSDPPEPGTWFWPWRLGTP